MTLSRRQTLKLGLGTLVGASVGGPLSAQGTTYLEDARTARGVKLRVPRTTLENCLAVLSRAVGVTLEAAPELKRETLVGAVPRRPLRETMSALESLFDAVWVASGSPATYRLQPNPGKWKARQQAQEKLLLELRKSLDTQAAEAVKKAKAEPLPTLDTPRRELFALLLWSELPPADRLQVLRGATVTRSVPEARAHPIYELAIAIASKEPGKLAGPLLVTFDMDDGRDEQAIPRIRARATGMRDNSVVGAIHSLEFYKAPERPRPKVEDGPALPMGIGSDGVLSGSRDEVVVALGEEGGVPILSRQRARGGSGPQVAVAGRPVGQVAADLAEACDAHLVSNSRGFILLRSNTELIDPAGAVPDAVNAYLKRRPAPGSAVPLDVLAELAALSPLQVAILQRSNLCTEETIAARELYTLLDFYRSLSPELRRSLASAEGLAASRLSHRQLHSLLGDKAMRAAWEVHTPLQEMKTLAFRVTETLDDPQVSLACLRNSRETEGTVTTSLPVVDEEDRPTASR